MPSDTARKEDVCDTTPERRHLTRRKEGKPPIATEEGQKRNSSLGKKGKGRLRKEKE